MMTTVLPVMSHLNFNQGPGGAGGEVEESEPLVSIELSIHYSCSDERSISRRRRAVTTAFSIRAP